MALMARRRFQVLRGGGAFVAGLMIILGAILYATGHFVGASDSAIGGPFKLIGYDGKPISNETFKDEPYLIYFGYTHCEDVCPTTLLEMSQVMRALGRDANDTAGLFITIDPERDTPAIMRNYLSKFDSHLLGATGKPAAIEKVEREFRVYVKRTPANDGNYSIDHSSVVYLMDKQGRFVAPFSFKRNPAESAAVMRKYM